MPYKSAVEVYQELREFVLKESRVQKDVFTKELSRPLQERIDTGRCVEHLQAVGPPIEKVHRFECPANLSEFREGDLVRIHHGDPFSNVIEFIWQRDGMLNPDRDFIDLVARDENPKLDPNNSYLLDASHFDNSHQMLKALEELGSSERGRERILPLLIQDCDDEEIDISEYEEARQAAEAKAFNDSQQEAIAEAVASKWLTLIQGPPGSGKTRVLAETVRQWVEKGHRVLVTASTHKAIHEALRAIRRAMPELLHIAKIGQAQWGREVPCDNYEFFQDCPFKDETGGYVIGATAFAAYSKLSNVDFDYLVIDEASQMTLPIAIMAMLRARTFLVIGDPAQLPPVVQSVPTSEAVQHSLFASLALQRSLLRLNVTYRMNAQIAAWISDEFYYGELIPSETSASRQLSLTGRPTQSWLEQTLDLSHSLIWLETKAPNTRQYSMEQASAVAQILCELQCRGHPLDDVAVVTPFRRQARVIRHRIRQSPELENGGWQAVVIDTVERMQGQERSVIIVSTASSNREFLAAIQDFLYLPQRLNVAVSRAKTKMITVAHPAFLETADVTEMNREAIERWKSLQRSSHLVVY